MPAVENPFVIRAPEDRRLPILVSCPHVGVEFPADIRAKLLPEVAAWPIDTDWFVHELYDFVTELGITLIHARYSRLVVDLNRPADSAPLYNDGRRETGVVPMGTFDGDPIYKSPEDTEYAASDAERVRRVKLYHEPYHRELARLVGEMRTEKRNVLLFDAHSIRPFVPAIRKERFPDLILGDQDGRTADASLGEAAMDAMCASSYGVSYNEPFKGGYITRHYGKPDMGIHTLQLEMSQSVYMDEALRELAPEKLRKIRPLLREVFARLAHRLEAMK